MCETVMRQGRPVRVDHADPPARAGHPYQFRDRRAGISEALEHPFGANAVEVVVGEVEGGDVAHDVGDRAAVVPGVSRGDDVGRVVEGDHRPSGAHD